MPAWAAALVIFAVFGLVAGCISRFTRESRRRYSFVALVAASALPYFLHYWYSLSYLERSGVEPYAGMSRYAVTAPVTMLALTFGAIYVASIKPLAAAAFPIMLAAMYWYLLVPMLYQDVPTFFVGLDNVPFVGLAAWSVCAATFPAALALQARKASTMVDGKVVHDAGARTAHCALS